MVPVSLEKLRELALAWELPSVNAAEIPGIPLHEFYSKARTPKPLTVPWALQEEEGKGYGLGIFPILECVAPAANRTLPSRHVLETEMTALLRNFKGAALVDRLDKLAEAITRESRPEDLPRPGVKLTWPKLKPAAANEDAEDNIQGKSS